MTAGASSCPPTPAVYCFKSCICTAQTPVGRSPGTADALPEPFSAERLNELRQRWERDPKSRAFLQLAEEYRRGGRLGDAVQVLEAGLKEHPTYLSAQVALGRCLLENGKPAPASALLERAVARDPTQLVANKLLVEAYLAAGQPTKARERLELYKLFNDRDVEIEPLEARIRALDGLPPAPLGPAKRGAQRVFPEAPVFELPAVAAPPEVRLELPPPRASPGMGAPGEPFGKLYSAGSRRRIEAAFLEAGIFSLPPPKPASATLGELYLAQGHFAEAEENFQSVLRDRPDDAAALAGLESVRGLRGDEAEAFLSEESAVAEESNLIVGGLTARKATLLKDYLARIRRGAQRHVS